MARSVGRGAFCSNEPWVLLRVYLYALVQMLLQARHTTAIHGVVLFVELLLLFPGGKEQEVDIDLVKVLAPRTSAPTHDDMGSTRCATTEAQAQLNPRRQTHRISSDK